MSFSLHVNQGNPARSIPVSNQVQPAGNMFKTLPYTAQLASSTTDQLDLTNPQAQGIIDQVQSVYINNKNNTSSITIITSTGQDITCPSGTQGWFPVLSSNPPVFNFSSFGGVDVVLMFCNMPMPADQWGTEGPLITVTLTDRSQASPNPAASFEILSSNPNRRYALIKAPETADLWINPTGGTAAVDGLGSFKIIQGGVYETNVAGWTGPVNAFTTGVGVNVNVAEA